MTALLTRYSKEIMRLPVDVIAPYMDRWILTKKGMRKETYKLISVTLGG